MDFQTFRNRTTEAVTAPVRDFAGGLGGIVVDQATSALSEMLDLPPRRVAQTEEPLPQEYEPLPAPEWPGATQNPFERVLMELEEAVDPEPDEVEYVPLTKDELLAKAEAKTEMWAALMALGVSLMSRLIAYQKLTERDMKHIRKFERETDKLGYAPEMSEHHPYWDAKDRYDAYEEAINDDQDEDGKSKFDLSEAKKSLLQRAFLADLKAKNTREALKQSGIAMTVMEIMAAQATEPLMGLGLVLVTGLTEKMMARR